MKNILLFAVALVVFSAPTNAQQKTTGDIIADGLERGRLIRDGIDARRQQKSQAALASADTAESPSSKPISPSPSVSPMVVILNSNNGLPRIVILPFKTSNCGDTARSAATTDKDGNTVHGCATVDRDAGTVIADWDKYGRKVYSLSEWSLELPGDADKKPLGE